MKKSLPQRFATIAGNYVSTNGYVSAIDLMPVLQWLTPEKLNDWKKGERSYLERIITINLSKISKAMKAFRSWANHSKLKPSITIYNHKSHKLRFSKFGHPNIEITYSTHYVLIKTEKTLQTTIEPNYNEH